MIKHAAVCIVRALRSFASAILAKADGRRVAGASKEDGAEKCLATCESRENIEVATLYVEPLDEALC